MDVVVVWHTLLRAVALFWIKQAFKNFIRLIDKWLIVTGMVAHRKTESWLTLLCACLLSSCRKTEVVFDQEETYSESGYALDKELTKFAEVKVKGSYSKNSETITCVVKAPNLYDYLLNNMEELSRLDDDQLYAQLLEYASDSTTPTLETEVEIPVVYADGKLCADTSSFEYQDAVAGGLHSAMTELFIQSIKDMKESVTQ